MRNVRKFYEGKIFYFNLLSRGANRPNMLGRFGDGLTCQTAPTSKNDENVGEMLAKHATSMSNHPNMLGQHVGMVCPRL